MRILLLVCALLLSSCASVLSPQIDQDAWQLVGKLSIRTENQTRVLNVDWRRSGDASRIDLSGPFGVTVARVEGHGDELTITTSKGIQRYRDDLAVMVSDDKAIQLPWHSLAFWVRGKTGPGAAPMIPDSGYSAGSWRIRVLQRDESGPRLMQFEHALATIKLKVREWRLGSELTR